MTDPLSIAETIHHAIEAAMVAGLTYVGRQFKKNRTSGHVRDSVVADMKNGMDRLTGEITRLTREVDQDRTATTMLRETVHGLEREFLRYLRGFGNGGG